MAQPAQDLTAASGLTQLSGRPVVEVADATLKAGTSLVQTWTELEPITKQLIRRLREHCEHKQIQGPEALKALAMTATVVQKVGAAAANVLRASEGMSKLALLLDAGRLRRAHPRDQSQQQLAATFLELAGQIVKKTGRCPFCQPVEASAKVTDA
jgi:hypothetical protein